MGKAASWIASNCRFAKGTPPSTSRYEAMLAELDKLAHEARLRLGGHTKRKMTAQTAVAEPPVAPPLMTSQPLASPQPSLPTIPISHPKPRTPPPAPQAPPNISDYIVIAAAMIGRYGLTEEQFFERMRNEFPIQYQQLAPYLEQIYVKARDEFNKRMPNIDAVQSARQYAQSMGFPEPKRHQYAKWDKDHAKKIADAFDKAQSNPLDPNVQAAYQALSREINLQYASLPVRVEKWQDTNSQPYRNSREMMQDVMDNKHMWVFAGGEPHDIMSADDIFKLRAVHDYYGHAMYGYEFGPRGEENAWIEHSKMFSPLARKALTAETRGQNSWVNAGPNSHLPADQRPYAQQKAALLPDEFNEHPAIAG